MGSRKYFGLTVFLILILLMVFVSYTAILKPKIVAVEEMTSKLSNTQQIYEEKRKQLLDCWLHNAPAHSSFMVKAKVEASDEWLHSFYYFNDEIPSDEDFEKTMADYLTFEFKMIANGRGYLFGYEED